MYGAFDIDSLQFETRCLLRKLRTLTGESEDDAIRRALEERYQRLTGAATVTDAVTAASAAAKLTSTQSQDLLRKTPGVAAETEMVQRPRR